MKRVIAIVLIAALCLALAACGGEPNPATALIGTWKSEDGKEMVFNTNSTGIVIGPNGHELDCSWSYLTETGEFELKGMAFGKGTVKITEQDGTSTITWNDIVYTKVG